ncbi:MAG: QueT transporter family protein [Clostridia bacterium]|nr:QueT transporter family protein [Clostridia bacterium]
MENNYSKYLVRTAIVAALYAALTLVLAPIGFGPLQFRVSEVMVLLVLIDKRFIAGLTLGAVVANYFSPLGIIDMVVGGSATFISLYLMIKSKNLYLAAFWPCIVNGIMVGGALSWFYALPFPIIGMQVFIGQVGVIYILGIPLYKFYKKKYS